MIDRLDDFGDEIKLAEAAKLLCDAEPPLWLLSYFRYVIIYIDDWYARGGGRIKRADAKEALTTLHEQVADLIKGLNGWGGVFAEGNENYQLIKDMRSKLPELLRAVEAAQAKFPERIKPGQGIASIAADPESVKVLFALGVHIAAHEIGKDRETTRLKRVCTKLFEASRLANPELNRINDFAGVKPIPPGDRDAWDRPLQDARSIQPQRDNNGRLDGTMFDNPMMIGAANFASLFMLAMQRDKLSGISG